MFKDFKNSLKLNELCDNKRELIKCFENVQMNLSVLFRKETENALDNIEALANLSTAVDLCTNIKKLIDQYLAFKGNNFDQLIIMIDDIDLNTKHAREMCEQLRKYFTHPNVIILMAVKLDQLSSAIKKDLTEEYSTLINNKDSNFSFDELDEMVERYLGKLIPHNHRLYLPEASVYFENSVRIISSEKGTSDVLGEYKSLRECVLSLIFEKTRYLFYNTKELTNYIIPRNLRELRQLISLLYEMDSYRNSDKEGKGEENIIWLKTRNYNQTLFIKYFCNTWCINNLTIKGNKIMQELFKITDPLLINKTVISLLRDYFNTSAILNGSDNDIQNITKPENKTYNISLGDALYVIRELQNIANNVSDMKLLFAMKFFYSYKLYTFYNFASEKGKISNDITNNDVFLGDYNYLEKIIAGNYINTDAVDVLAKKNISDEEFPQIDISGFNNSFTSEVYNIINTNESEPSSCIDHLCSILPRKQKQNKSLMKAFDRYCVNKKSKDLISNLNRYLTDTNTREKQTIKTALKNYLDLVEKAYKTNSISRTKLKANIQFIKKLPETSDEEVKFKEILYTLVSKRYKPSEESSYRAKEEVRFDSSFSLSNIKNAYIDITSPFFNLIDIKKCYGRFYDGDDNNFFYKALLTPNSFISNLINKLSKVKPETSSLVSQFKEKQATGNQGIGNNEAIELIYNELHPHLLSMITVRNIEILEAFENFLIKIKNKNLYDTDNEFITYANYFQEISKFSMPTYTVDKENGKNINIDFSFFEAYAETLKNNTSSETFKSIISNQ